jgi:peptidase E
MATRFLSLMDFFDGYNVSLKKDFILAELDWLFTKTANPQKALLVSYAYKGADFTSFFTDLKVIFDAKGIQLTDINDKIAGTPKDLVNNAKMFVFCGGELASLISGLNALKASGFDPYPVIKNKIETGVPYLGWNEGSVITSALEYAFPNNPIQSALKCVPYELIRNYTNNDNTSANPIKQFLTQNTGIKMAFAMVDRVKEDKSSVRLEESGGGLLYSIINKPLVTRYFLDKSGNLIHD